MNYDEEDAEARAAEPKNGLYTGKPCNRCGRIRVYERTDGQFECEKCGEIRMNTEASDA